MNVDQAPASRLPSQLYRHPDLRRLLAPGSIAVYGATTRPGSFGERTVRNLLSFNGEVFPVNQKYEEVLGRKCYPSLKALPKSPDCVVIVAGRESVESMVEDAIEAKAGGILIYASGYSETGKADRIAQQDKLAKLARLSGIPIIGPNCIGIYNLTLGMATTFNPTDLPKREEKAAGIGLITQSGALGISLLQGVKTGFSFSHVLTSGNSCDVDAADYIAYLAEDPDCKVIACLFEGMSDPRRIFDAASVAWDHGKPVVMYKIATGEEGAHAAVSHTGSLAGSNAAYMAMFERAGIVVVHDFEALIETAALFAKAGRMRGAGVAVVSSSGGASIICADKAEKFDVPLPQPNAETTAILKMHIPEFGSARNPCDVTAQVLSDPKSLPACCEALITDEEFGALVLPHLVASESSAERIKILAELGRKHGKLMCLAWMTAWSDGPGSLQAELEPHVALFRSVDRCFAAISAWQKREKRLAAGQSLRSRTAPVDAGERSRKLISKATADVLTERESKELLQAYGIRVTQERLASSAADAEVIATELGFPVAMKLESPDVPHKTQAGVIRLNIRDREQARVAFDSIMVNAARVEPAPRINGVLVQQMIPPGAEMMIGVRVDPLFGPLVLVGLGGVMVELVKDTALQLAPVSRDEALNLLSSLKGQRLLDGFRGGAAVDREALADTIVRVSELAADLTDEISEIDVNPLICHGTSIIAVDALVVRRKVRAAP
ncbi:acetate--CoA ligase family protein [Bradyrhizobium sp. 195]|uniref:acetate--CoA ligase family protein n=1 Tax=Bradyrhizobium sp. 195 TaxID=2782662 RepID=UPI0020010052|nr:acetate--CoA ligase family protein [Bradyrhizobium sp. 195]UPK29956.1 acetate--CoA ligase family protein [Bradyrhizobium sp. 195]